MQFGNSNNNQGLEDNSMDFDFTGESEQNTSTEESEGSNNRQRRGKRGKDKKLFKHGFVITNNYIRNTLIYAALVFVITILLIIIIKPPKPQVSDVRLNTSCDSTRLFDDALAMSIGEREELQVKIDEYQDKLKADIVIATVNLDDPSLIREYGKKIYESNNFGWDKSSGDGLILVYETLSDKIELVTYGRLVDSINDKGLKKLSKAIRSEGNTTYFLKSMSFLSALNGSINPNTAQGLGIAVLLLLRNACIFSLIPTIIMILLYKRNVSKHLNESYLDGGKNSRIQYDVKKDTLVNSVTTSRRKQKSDSSGGSSRSDGGSRTGGGSL